MELKGTAKTLDQMGLENAHGVLDEKGKKYLETHERYNEGEEATNLPTGGGDKLQGHQNSFLVVRDSDEYDKLKEATRGEIPIRYVQDRNDDGTFAEDNRADGREHKQYKNATFDFTFAGKHYQGQSGMVEFVNYFTHLRSGQLLYQARKDPNNFALAARLAAENFGFEAQEIKDEKAKEAIQNRYYETDSYKVNVFKDMNYRNILGLFKTSKEEDLKDETSKKIVGIIKKGAKQQFEDLNKKIKALTGDEDALVRAISHKGNREILEKYGFDISTLVGGKSVAEERKEKEEKEAALQKKREEREAKREEKRQADVATQEQRENLAKSNEARIAETDELASKIDDKKREELRKEINENPNAKEIQKDLGSFQKFSDGLLSQKEKERFTSQYGLDPAKTRISPQEFQNKILGVYDKELREQLKPEEKPTEEVKPTEEQLKKQQKDEKISQKAEQALSSVDLNNVYQKAINDENFFAFKDLLRFDLPPARRKELADRLGINFDEIKSMGPNQLKEYFTKANDDIKQKIAKIYLESLISNKQIEEAQKKREEESKSKVLETMGLSKEDLDKEDR